MPPISNRTVSIRADEKFKNLLRETKEKFNSTEREITAALVEIARADSEFNEKMNKELRRLFNDKHH